MRTKSLRRKRSIGTNRTKVGAAVHFVTNNVYPAQDLLQGSVTQRIGP